jgi:type IV secretion system protein VirB10
MNVSLLDVLRRRNVRLSWSRWRTTAADDISGSGERSSVPGRHAAIEAVLSPLRKTTPSTLTTLGFSLIAAAVLSWYYAHAYARAHVPAPDRIAHVADAADIPLPPLAHTEPSGLVSGMANGSAYIIGNILDSDGDRLRQNATANAQSAHGEQPTLADSTTGVSAAAKSQLRPLDGAVFTRTTGPGDGPTPIHPNPNSSGGGTEENPVAQLLRAETTPTVVASMLPTQRLLLPKGAFLDCTLETAIDSTLPGLTTCITAYDTFSADGTVVLMERGTKLIGEMRSQVQQGTARVFVLWTEARTPKGIVVALDSPGTDELGRSGLPGTVDRHFADRFGAAILVSIIGGAIQSAVNRSQQSGGTVILNPSGAGDVATEVLRSTLNIPPTVRIAQGERIQVLVARDLDFRSVYTLRAR